ncbi:MATE family efflux transporter [Chloroflexota bacterium]
MEQEVGGVGDGGKGKYGRDWTQGSVIGSLMSLSWPMLVTRGFMSLAPTIDLIVVGRLGAASVAGVGIGAIATGVVQSLKMGLTVGTRAMVARFIGAGDEEGANRVAQQGFVITAVFTALLSAVGYFLTEPILELLGAEPDVIAQGAPYIRITFVVSIFMTCRMLTDAIMEASGDTKTPMKLTIIYRLFHSALCPFMVYGWWIFPRLETSGAAWTGVASQGLALALGLRILLTGRSRLRLSFKNFSFDRNILWRIVKVGIPASISGMGMSLAQFLLLSFITPFGTLAVAAHALAQRVNMFVHMPAMALGMGAGVLAGQNMGANHPERAERTSWLTVGIGTCLMILVSLGMWFGAESIVRVFTSQPDLVALAATFLRISIASVLFFGPSQMLPQCLNGMGDTLPPMAATVISLWGVQVPLAYFLPKVGNLGVYGVRWALVGGVIVRGIAFLIYFPLGRWKHKHV